MKTLLIPILAIALLASCNNAKDESSEEKTTESQQTILKIDGSSTVYPITEAVAEDF